MLATWNSDKPQSSGVRRSLESLFEECDIQINGTRAWDIQVLNEGFYARVLAGGSLAFGESYMDRWWEVRDLEQLIYLLLEGRLDERVRSWREVLAYCKAAFFNRQRRARAFVVGERHYDIGNDLYESMLDPRMIYSCGYWNGVDTLEAAQRAKLDLVFGKLALEPRNRVLDVGCGWGGALEYAATKYNVEGVGITVSREQAEYARRKCARLPVTIRLDDYRDLDGQFDHIYSIGMFEHVGPKNYRTYMQVLRRCLRPGGRFLLHTIGANEVSGRSGTDPWIEKYIFPNSKLPVREQIEAAIDGLFKVTGLQCIGAHYVPTLRAWKQNFERHWPQLKSTRDERFYRMWEYYLNCSAAGFRAERNDVWQLLLTPL